MPQVYFLRYELRPMPEGEHYSTAGGAIANCFIAAESPEKARELALITFHENGWEVVSVEDEATPVAREDHAERSEWLEHYDQAATDGECYVFHQWSPDPQEDDAVH